MIFDDDGVLLDNPSVDAIRWLRQISRTFKKVFEVCEPSRVETAIEKFVQLDAELPSKADIKSSLDPYAPRVAQILFGSLIGSAMTSPFKGSHGPGAVSERLGTNSRWNFSTISVDADSLVGSEEFRPNWESLQNRPPTFGTIPARLEAVPKTAEKPRLISIEPSYNQFMQQSLLKKLRKGLRDARSVCAFDSQDDNRMMAKNGSYNGSIATVDLSDASDRVSMALVEQLFGFSPAFLRYLRLSRSAFVQLPGGDLALLNKFASMGSALTFPVEAMVFTALVVTSICRGRGNFSPSFVKNLGTQGSGLRIYGDDIILSVKDAPAAIAALELNGLKVNASKSFLSGKFRESCGLDAFDGVDVTPAYMRRNLPRKRDDTSEITSLTSFRNQIWEKHGDCHTTRGLDEFLTRRFRLTYVPSGTECVGIWCLPHDPQLEATSRWNSVLQRMEVKALMPNHSYRKDNGNEDGTLFKSLKTNKGSLSAFNLLELERKLRSKHNFLKRLVEKDIPGVDGRPVASKLYYRWVAVR
jgi:hypothetical protein